MWLALCFDLSIDSKSEPWDLKWYRQVAHLRWSSWQGRHLAAHPDSITSVLTSSRLSRRSLLAYLIKALPHLTVDTTSSVAPSTTLYVHIFAFDLARAVRYAVHSVGKESSLIQWSGASCICTVNRLKASGVWGEYNRRKAGLLLVATSLSLRLNLKDHPWISGPMLYLLLHQVKWHKSLPPPNKNLDALI